MGVYRLSRNIEASLIDFFTEQFEIDWSEFNIRTVKVFLQAYEGTLPAVCIEEVTTNPVKKEIGSSAWLKIPEISIRVFATSDGLRKDLRDYIIDKLEGNIPYYQYTITDGGVTEKTLAGQIVVREILRDAKELTNTENLELADKFRHIIIFSAIIALS
ncbi:MAG: hypothetical protein ACTSQJ_18560 [Promethearchaeota archaeon]